MNRTQCIHLLLEEITGTIVTRPRGRADSAAGSEDPSKAWRIEIPAGISYLKAEKGERLRLTPVPPEDQAGIYMVEQVMRDHAPKLLVLSMGKTTPKVNGQSAPPVVLLDEGDEVLFGSVGCVGHVAIFNNAAVGPLPEEGMGKMCPICLLSFTWSSTTYVCANCGTAYHHESVEQHGEVPFRCSQEARLCLVCRTPMNLSSGYSSVPEYFRDC